MLWRHNFGTNPCCCACLEATLRPNLISMKIPVSLNLLLLANKLRDWRIILSGIPWFVLFLYTPTSLGDTLGSHWISTYLSSEWKSWSHLRLKLNNLIDHQQVSCSSANLVRGPARCNLQDHERIRARPSVHRLAPEHQVRILHHKDEFDLEHRENKADSERAKSFISQLSLNIFRISFWYAESDLAF